MKKEPNENTEKVNDEKQSVEMNTKTDEKNKLPEVSIIKAEKELKKSISRWDSDGGVDLCE